MYRFVTKHILAFAAAAAILMGLSSAPMYAQQKSSRTQKVLEAALVDAVNDYDTGKYKDAFHKLSSIADADPLNDAAYFYMGMCHLEAGNLDDAQRYLSEAARLDSSNYWYKDRLAIAYRSAGKYAEAVGLYEDILAKDPQKVDTYYQLVNLYAAQGNMDKVLSTLDDIEQVSGKSEAVTQARYDILSRMGRTKDAYAVLEAYNADYSSPQVLSMMADTKAAEGEDSLALSYYNQALELEPSFPAALAGESEIYRTSMQYEKFFQTMNRFVRSADIPVDPKCQYLTQLFQHMDPRFVHNWKSSLDTLVNNCVLTHPTDTASLQMAGIYYYQSEQFDRAKTYLKQNRDLHSDMENPHILYGQALSLMKDWDALEEAGEAAFSAFPDKPDFLEFKIIADYNRQDYAGIIKEANRMIQTAPKDSATCLYAYTTMGDTYHEMGEAKQAYKAYDKALKINPKYAAVLNNYAYYLSLEGKHLKKAYQMSMETITQEPDNATYLDTFAWILHLQGKDIEAKPFFKHAMLYGGKDSSTMLEHYAEVLEALGEKDQAAVYRNLAEKKKAEGK